jgi:4-amino-4-deoxy-L-arabinose transferase-like glycosyltransferase
MLDAPAPRVPWRTVGLRSSATWIVIGLTALALVLRWGYVHQSLFGDELFLWAIVNGHSLGQVFSMIHDTEKTPPLGFVLSSLSAHLGDAPELVRIPSLVASAATVPLLYLLGRRTVGAGAGIVAAAWFALSPFEIFYGTEARSYALVAAFVVLSTLALLAALDGGGRWWCALYAGAAAAAVYSHYIALLTLVPQAAWALWAHRESAREQLIAGAVALLAFLPWLPSFLVQARHSADEARRISEIVPLTLSNAAHFTLEALVSRQWVALSDLPGRVPLAILGALAAGLLTVVVSKARTGTARLGSTLAGSTGLLVLLALAPLVGLVLYSVRPDTSLLLSRNLSCAAPYAFLVFGRLLTYPRGRLAAVLSIAALGALSVGTIKTLGAGYQRPDARDAADFIEAHAPPSAPGVDVPGPHGIRTYLEPSRRVYTTSEFGAAEWEAAARTRSPVFFSSLDASAYLGALTPPPQYARRYRLIATHISPGIPFGLVVREYAPR